MAKEIIESEITLLDSVKEMLLLEIKKCIGQGVTGSYLVDLTTAYNNLK